MVNDEDDLAAGQVAKRVVRGGIALLHDGEVVLPAAGSEAQAEAAIGDARTVVQYHFPVVIEVRGGGHAIDHDAIAEHVLQKLARKLEVL